MSEVNTEKDALSPVSIVPLPGFDMLLEILLKIPFLPRNCTTPKPLLFFCHAVNPARNFMKTSVKRSS